MEGAFSRGPKTQGPGDDPCQGRTDVPVLARSCACLFSTIGAGMGARPQTRETRLGRPGWDAMDEALRAELLEMERCDRAVRAALVARGELHRPGYHPEMEAVHRRHNARMRAIIAACGWPGYTLVGED